MRIEPPPFGVAITQKNGLISDVWQRWFRFMWDILGIGKQHQFAEVFCRAQQTMNNGSDTSWSFALEVPNRFRTGVTVTPFAWWKPADGGAGSVRLDLSTEIAGDDETPTPATETVTDAAPSSAGQYLRTTFTAVSGAAKGGLIAGSITRKGTVDTYGAAITLLGVGYKFAVDGVGWEVAFP